MWGDGALLGCPPLLGSLRAAVRPANAASEDCRQPDHASAAVPAGAWGPGWHHRRRGCAAMGRQCSQAERGPRRHPRGWGGGLAGADGGLVCECGGRDVGIGLRRKRQQSQLMISIPILGRPGRPVSHSLHPAAPTVHAFTGLRDGLGGVPTPALAPHVRLYLGPWPADFPAEDGGTVARDDALGDHEARAEVGRCDVLEGHRLRVDSGGWLQALARLPAKKAAHATAPITSRTSLMAPPHL